MARLMVLCSLPRSNPGDRHQYKRVNGPYKFILSRTGEYKLPYGNLPRLILAWLCTEAVQTQSRELALGRSLSDCIRNAVPSNNRLSEVVFQAQAETEQLHVVCHDGARYRFAPVPAQIRHVAAQRNPFETLAMEG